MPSPSTSLATRRPDLGASLEEFSLEADRAGFVSLQALPVFEAAEQSGTFGRIPVEELLKQRETRRAPKSGYSRDDYAFVDDFYVCTEHGHESPIDDREARMYRNYFDVELLSARRARDVVLRNMEVDAANLLFDTNTFANAAGSDWTSWGTATPIDDVEAAVQAIYAASGLWANGIIIPRLTYRHLRNCEQIVERLNGMGIRDVVPERIGAEQLALVFDLPKVMIAGGTKNTAAEGQTAVFDGIWDKNMVLVGRFAMSNDIQEPCIGRTFHWAEDGSEIGAVIETYRDETRRGDVVRARNDRHQKLLHPQAGRLITGVNS